MTFNRFATRQIYFNMTPFAFQNTININFHADVCILGLTGVGEPRTFYCMLDILDSEVMIVYPGRIYCHGGLQKVLRLTIFEHLMTAIVCFCSCVNSQLEPSVPKCFSSLVCCVTLYKLFFFSFSLTKLALSIIVIFWSWSLIFDTIVGLSSLQAEAGLPDLGILATFERSDLNCWHQFFTESYDRQAPWNNGSISLFISVGDFPCNIRHFTTTLAAFFSTNLSNF